MFFLTVIFAHPVGHGVAGPLLGGVPHEVNGEPGPGIEVLNQNNFIATLAYLKSVHHLTSGRAMSPSIR